MNNSTIRLLGAALILLLVAGCASQWHADRPVQATATIVPEYRDPRSVGNLRRLVVLPPRVVALASFNRTVEIPADWRISAAWSESTQRARVLSEDKGYDVRVIIDESGAWLDNVIVHPETVTADQLRSEWEHAETPEAIGAAVRRIGAACDADGVVGGLAFVRVSDTFGTTMALAMLNLFSANSLLLHHLSTLSSEAVIYETHTGEPVWRSTRKGEDYAHTDTLFQDLENAVPAVLAPHMH